jgi:rubrerythrin
MSGGLDEAIQLARKMEMDGIKFYTKAAAQAANPQGRMLFESLAADEKRHLQIVEKISKGFGVDVSAMPMPADSIKTVFTNAREKIGEEEMVAAGEKEAIRYAQGMEKDSYDLYVRCADQAEGAQEQTIFARLAEEENQHYVILDNTLEYLEQNAKWMLWDEYGLLTGDLSSLQ